MILNGTNMNVLIVGGTGVLSGAFVAEALRQKMKITMINRGRRIKTLPEGVSLIKADKDDYQLIEQNLRGGCFDCVIDFLCSSQDQLKKSFLFYSNYAAQYVFISSCAVFNKELPGLKKEDSEKPQKTWDYSIDKWQSEELLKQLSLRSNCNYTIVRPCVTYDNTRIPYGIAPRYRYHWTFVARAKAGKPIITWNNGGNVSNMLRVEDFAVGLAGVIGNPNAYQQDFNVCGDEMPSYSDVIHYMEEALNITIPRIDIPSAFYAKVAKSKSGEILGGRSLDATNDNSKIKEVVPSFKQTIFLKDGIKRSLDAYKYNNYYLGIDFNFDGECDCVINKWCEANHIDSSQFNLGFVDYLGNATEQEKNNYWKAFHQDAFYIKIISFFEKVKSFFKARL